MAYQPMVTVNISLKTTPIQRASFGIPLFIGSHAFFTERTRSYSRTSDVAEDFPTTSDEYIAAAGAFSQDNSPNLIKIGRRAVDTVILTPDAVTSAGQTFTVTVTGTDGVPTSATFTTTTGTETASDVVTDLLADLGTITGVTISGTVGINLSPSTAAPFSVSAIKRLEAVSTSTEDPEDTLVAIEEFDDEWYFASASDHTQAYTNAMAAAIESRNKIYFFSTSDVSTYGAYSDASADQLSKVKDLGYLRTSGWYHDEADTVFPELTYIVIGSVYDPGKGVWANKAVSVAGGSARNSDGNYLTVNQKTNLEARNGNFVEQVGGGPTTSPKSGKVAGGEWVDVIRNRDFMVARSTEALVSYMKKSPVVGYIQPGIDGLESKLNAVFSRYVSTDKETNILDSENPFTISFKKASEISPEEKATRVFTGTFALKLAGAIQIANISGTMSYNGQGA